MQRKIWMTGAAVVASLALVACKTRTETQRVEARDAHIVAQDTARKLGAGDIRISTVDSSIDVALVGDTVVGGFGARVRREIAEKTDTTTDPEGGLGASISKFVKGTVASALRHDLAFPVSEISDVRYENGELQFFGTNGKRMRVFEKSKNGRESSETFKPEDAQAFVAAFKARKAGR